MKTQTHSRSPILLHPEVTLATSGRSNCYIATNQKKALFVERLTSRESKESQQTTDNARANERNKSSLLISQRMQPNINEVNGQQTTDVEV